MTDDMTLNRQVAMTQESQQLRDALLKQARLAAVTPAPVHTHGAVS